MELRIEIINVHKHDSKIVDGGVSISNCGGVVGGDSSIRLDSELFYW